MTRAYLAYSSSIVKQVQDLVNELDPKFREISSARIMKSGIPNHPPVVEDGSLETNREIINEVADAKEITRTIPDSYTPYKVKAFSQILGILQKYSASIRFSSTAVILVILRLEGMKYSGEERYYVGHGCHKSSILNAIERAIIHSKQKPMN